MSSYAMFARGASTHCKACRSPLWKDEYLYCKYCKSEPQEDEPIDTTGSAGDPYFKKKWKKAQQANTRKKKRDPASPEIPSVRYEVEEEKVAS